MEIGGGWRKFTPAESEDWDPVPETVGAALDQLAAREGNIAYHDATILFSALGSGASDSIAIAEFPTNVILVGVVARAGTQFTGEADLAFEVGYEGGDVNAFIESTPLHQTGNGTPIAVVQGVVKGGQFLEDASGDGLAVRFTATELDDVSAGSLTVRFYYLQAF